MVNECVSPWSGGPTFSSILVSAAVARNVRSTSGALSMMSVWALLLAIAGMWMFVVPLREWLLK